MDAAKREALEQAGFQIGDVQQFLGLSDWETQIVELKLALRKSVRALREEQRLTQQDVAKKIHSSQSRIAKMETGSGDVSIDLLMRYFFALGGSLKQLEMSTEQGKKGSPTRKKNTVA